jgi:type IV pilus assembly protein PilB
VPPRPLGQILVEMGAIDELQLRSALAHHQQWGAHLGKSVVDLGFCSQSDVMRALSLQTGHALVDLDSTPLDEKLKTALPVAAAIHLRAVPLRLEGKRAEVLVAAVAAPAPMDVTDELRKASGKKRVVVQLASDDAIQRAIAEVYNGLPRQVMASHVTIDAQIPNESTFEVAPRSKSAQPMKVWLYGWNSAREKALVEMLRQAGISAQPLPDEALEHPPATDVLLVSTLGVQAYIPAGQKIPSQKVIVLGQGGDQDLADARALGARIYLRPPFTPEKLRQSIERLGQER